MPSGDPAAEPSATASSSAHPANASGSQQSQIQSLHKQLQSALQEIGNLRQRALAESQSQASLSGLEAEAAASESVWRPAWDGFRRGFVLAYGIRAGLGTMTRALALAKAGQYKDLQSWRLVSEQGLKYREDAVRLGLFIGGFTGSYHLISGALTRWQGSLSPAHNCMAAGTAAGLTLMFLSKERRRTLALYMLARIAQCLYNSLKQQGLFHFWGSDWAYGDALLFALSSAQVMYAYVMRPETLPKSYWKFIVKSGPVEEPALEAVRRSIRKLPIDLHAFNAFLKRRGSAAVLATAFPKQISDAMLHPQTASALRHNLDVPLNTFRKTFPLYMSISLVPYVVLNLRRALRNPLGTAAHAVGSAVRSTTFLSAFVGIYSSMITLHRKLLSWDHKLVYYVAGLAASGSILIEKKSRRSELALYVMPRAVDSFVLALTKKRWVPSVKYGEVFLFSLCMGGLMYYRQHEPDTMAPLLNTLITRIVFGQTKKPGPDLPRPASITFSEGDFPGGHQQFEGFTSQPSSLGSSPTRAAPSAVQHSTDFLQPSPQEGSTSGVPGQADAERSSPARSSSQPALAQGASLQLSATDQSKESEAVTQQQQQQQQQQQGPAMLSLQTPSEERHRSYDTSGAASLDANQDSTQPAQHGYNGTKDHSDAAPTSDRSHGEASGDKGTQQIAQAGASSSETEPASREGSSALATFPGEQESFAELVQGTEQLLGMLAARNIS